MEDLKPCPFCGSTPVRMLWLPEGVETGEVSCPAAASDRGFECPIEGVEITEADWQKRS